jgi:single-strand selective monofunctional uracil DNA glycosylase
MVGTPNTHFMSKHPLITAADDLRNDLRGLKFPDPVAYTYNPLEYAWDRHCDYLKNFGSGTKKVLFLGMNPGPYGMAQTGVPFGEISHVRDWMGISGSVEKPDLEHPKRPITGFNCERSEVSGRRLWGLFSELFDSADAFFKNHFVANFCPLVWMKETGANLTPDKLPNNCMEPVEKSCRESLARIIEILQPEKLIGIGAFAEKQLAFVKEDHQQLGKILHPSPASPAANRDFSGTATQQLIALDIIDGA